MSEVTLHGIRNCDTMKKARAWLDGAGVPYRFHDYKVEGLPAATLDAWIAQVGWERLLNRAGTTFRKVVPEAARPSVDAVRARELMLEHPSMVRRPVLDVEGSLLVGFDIGAYEQALRTAR